MITWITENVAIGERADFVFPRLGDSQKRFKEAKIDCVLDLTVNNDIVEGIFCDKLGINYYHIPVGRHQGLKPIKIELRTAAYMLEQLTEKYKRILVHCTAGIDRAPFVVAYWIAGYSGYGKDINFIYSKEFNFNFWISKAYELIKEKRSQVIEHMEWI